MQTSFRRLNLLVRSVRASRIIQEIQIILVKRLLITNFKISVPFSIKLIGKIVTETILFCKFMTQKRIHLMIHCLTLVAETQFDQNSRKISNQKCKKLAKLKKIKPIIKQRIQIQKQLQRLGWIVIFRIFLIHWIVVNQKCCKNIIVKVIDFRLSSII